MADSVVLRVPIGDGTTDFIEVQVSRSDLVGLTESGVVLAARDGASFDAASYTLTGAIERVIPAMRTILRRLRDGIDAPDEVTMNVGLQIGGETGFVFAKGTAQATIGVSMVWRQKAAE